MSPNRERLGEFERFIRFVNERCLWERGLRESYVGPDEALGPEVEYFSPQITMDDRMRYIMEHIVTDPYLSLPNKICNTIISHFYGARGIHQTLTGISDPDQAHVDFERIALEQRSGVLDYTLKMRELSVAAKETGVPIWGTTELHTSLQSEARKFVRERCEDKQTPFALAEWIASWINSGFIDGFSRCESLEAAYNMLVSHAGVGPYYGYHCATSNSVNPELEWDHDERFCVPGPGARDSVSYLFDGIKPAQMGKAVIWLRENQHVVLPGLTGIWDEWSFNVEANGVTIFADAQDELKTYGTEVGLCQWSVYRRLKANPHLIKNRKVSRAEVVQVCTLDTFLD